MVPLLPEESLPQSQHLWTKDTRYLHTCTHMHTHTPYSGETHDDCCRTIQKGGNRKYREVTGSSQIWNLARQVLAISALGVGLGMIQLCPLCCFFTLWVFFFSWEMASICKRIFFSVCFPPIAVQRLKGLSSFCILYPFNFKVTMFVCLLSCFSHVWLFVTGWTIGRYSSVHGIFQAKILEWVARPASKGSSQPRDQTHISLFIMI